MCACQERDCVHTTAAVAAEPYARTHTSRLHRYNIAGRIKFYFYYFNLFSFMSVLFCDRLGEKNRKSFIKKTNWFLFILEL